VCGLLAQATATPWIVAAGLLLIGAMIIAAYADEPLAEGEAGTATVIAVLLCYVWGVMVWYGHMQMAVALEVAPATPPRFKTELHGFSDRLAPGDGLNTHEKAFLAVLRSWGSGLTWINMQRRRASEYRSVSQRQKRWAWSLLLMQTQRVRCCCDACAPR
jgi:hypothetical protein